jgi:hypothetical protein
LNNLQGAHHVSLAGDDARQQSQFIYVRRYFSFTLISIALDRETFKVMWQMSEENEPAEKCFMRIQELEYFIGTKDQFSAIHVMPDVSAPLDLNLLAFIESSFESSARRSLLLPLTPDTHSQRSLSTRPSIFPICCQFSLETVVRLFVPRSCMSLKLRKDRTLPPNQVSYGAPKS